MGTNSGTAGFCTNITFLLQKLIALENVNQITLNNNEHAYAGQLNSFTHLRALLVLHDRSIL
jgi:hypothetical protein